MEEDKNPVGNEHPLRGLLYCFALLLAAAAVVASCCCAGCASEPQLPPGAVDFITNSIQRAITQIEKTRERDAAQDPIPNGSTPEEMDDQDPATEGATGVAPTSGSVAGSLVFRYGGFDGSRAVEDPATQIRAFKFSSSGMSYAWAKGDLGNWGLAHTDAGALACAFYWSDREQAWIGGKFDWISTSRTTRDWKNVYGYKGWDPDAFFSAKRHAFCIVSKDGRKRTNLVED